MVNYFPNGLKIPSQHTGEYMSNLTPGKTLKTYFEVLQELIKTHRVFNSNGDEITSIIATRRTLIFNDGINIKYRASDFISSKGVQAIFKPLIIINNERFFKLSQINDDFPNPRLIELFPFEQNKLITKIKEVLNDS